MKAQDVFTAPHEEYPLTFFNRNRVKGFWIPLDLPRKEVMTSINDELGGKYIYDSLSALERGGYLALKSSQSQMICGRARKVMNITVHEVCFPESCRGSKIIGNPKNDAILELLRSIVFLTRRSKPSPSSSPMLKYANNGNEEQIKIGGYFAPGSEIQEESWGFLMKIKAGCLNNFWDLALAINPLTFAGPKKLPHAKKLGAYMMTWVNSLNQYPNSLMMSSPMEGLARGIISYIEFQILGAFLKAPSMSRSLCESLSGSMGFGRQATSSFRPRCGIDETPDNLSTNTAGKPLDKSVGPGENEGQLVLFRDKDDKVPRITLSVLKDGTKSPKGGEQLNENNNSVSEDLLYNCLDDDEEQKSHLEPPAKSRSNSQKSIANLLDDFDQSPDEKMLEELASEFNARMRSLHAGI